MCSRLHFVAIRHTPAWRAAPGLSRGTRPLPLLPPAGPCMNCLHGACQRGRSTQKTFLMPSLACLITAVLQPCKAL